MGKHRPRPVLTSSLSEPNALTLQQQGIQDELPANAELEQDSAAAAAASSIESINPPTSQIFEVTRTLNLEFSKHDTVNQWKRMLECDVFVGAKRSKHTAVSYKDAIYVFGGDKGNIMLNDLIRFDVKEKSWGRAFSIGLAPAPRYHHSAVVYGSSMLVFGGYTGDIHSNSNLRNKNDLFEYTFQTGQWHEWKFTGRLPVARSAHGAAVYNDKLWIYAGYDGNARLNDMWTVNLKTKSKQWEQIQQKGDCPPTCCNFPVAVARDCMYVFSGQSGLLITNTLFEFNFNNLTWRRIPNDRLLRITPSPPSRRYGHTMVHHDRFLYVFGGSADNTLPNDLYTYDLDAQTWSTILPTSSGMQVPSGRVYHASAVYGDAMYIYGGTTDNNIRSGEMFKFQFPLYSACTLHSDYQWLLNSKQFCDVIFIVGPNQTEILAHSVMIAARSQVLKMEILKERESTTVGNVGDDSKNSMVTVTLPNVDPNAFNMVLNYIYTDQMELKESLNVDQVVTLLMDIYRLAELYYIPRLLQLCLHYLEMKILRSNVLNALNNADILNLNTIKEYCLQFIVRDENLNEIVMADEFKQLEKPLILDVIRKRIINSLPPTANSIGNSQHPSSSSYLNSNVMGVAATGGFNLGTGTAGNNVNIGACTSAAAVAAAAAAAAGNKVNVGACTSAAAAAAAAAANLDPSSIQSTSKTPPTEQPHPRKCVASLKNDLAMFLSDGGKEFCDFHLLLNGHLIPAHKAILAARSSYFQAMFRSFMPPDNCVKIQIGEEIPSLKAFQALLRYIYSGEIKMQPQDSLYLIEAPSFYGFTNDRLQTFCRHNLEHNINYQNVLHVLEAADEMYVPEVKNYALRMISNEFSKIGRLPKLITLSRELLLDMITTLSDNIGEIRARTELASKHSSMICIHCCNEIDPIRPKDCSIFSHYKKK